MRFLRGRWTALTAVAVVTPFLLLTGCKSGTNLIALPKMPSMPSLSWGKKKSGMELAKKGDLAPPSQAALAGQNGDAPLYANRSYPDTQLPAPQPGMGGPSNYGAPPSYASAPTTRGGQDPLYRQPDYYSPSPAYAGAGGYQDPYRPNYDRTATLPSSPGSTGGFGSQSNPYGDSYSPGPYQGSSFRRDGSAGGALPGSMPASGTPAYNDGSYPRPAAFESKMGATSRDGGYGTTVDPTRSRSGAGLGASDGAIRLAKGGPNDDYPSSVAPAGTCTSESCAVPASASHDRYDTSGGSNWRPGGTSDFDASQWSPESTRTATRSASTPSSGYRNQTGSPSYEQPAGGEYPYGGSSPSRDSGFGPTSSYR